MSKNDSKNRARDPVKQGNSSSNKAKTSAQSAGKSQISKSVPGRLIDHEVLTQRDERVATAMATNALSRERHELMMRSVVVLLALLSVVLAVNVFLGLREPSFKYYVLNTDGKVMGVTPLENPVQGSDQVVRWAADAVSSAFTLNFSNYTAQMAENRYLFTESGWRGFDEALTRSGFLNSIITQKLISTAVVAGAPIISSSGTDENGNYSWEVQVKLKISYDSASRPVDSDMTVIAKIQRVPESVNPRGLAISNIVSR